ncbi:MAG: hypothetical protein ACQEXJ_22745 [Myxococcota bacterium]
MRRHLLIFAVGIPAVLTACQGSNVDGDLVDHVETVVEPAAVAAGQPATVTCTLRRGNGDAVEGVTEFTVEPADGRSVEGDQVVPTTAGTYTVRCAAPDYEMVDPEGATLTVNPAAPAKVTTLLDDSSIPVHSNTNAECAVEDEFGNAVEADTTVTADEGVSVADHVVGAEEVGTYEVRCAVDGAPDVEVIPADLDVTAGEPATVELLADPDRDNYFIDAKVTLYWIVRDQWGNEVPNVPGTLTAPSTGVAELDAAAHEYLLEAEGLHTFSVTLDAPYQGLTDDLTLVVDDSGPDIVIPWPERGQTIQGEGGFMEIEGTVTDAFSDVAAFEINGEHVDVAEDGSFTYSLLPYWGVNIILAEAEDEHGNWTKLTPTFAYSREYLDFVDQDARGVKQEDGAAVLVGQAFLDDGDHDPSHVNDLATLVEVLLSDIDLVGLVEDMGGGAGGFHLWNQEVFAPSFTIGPVTVGATGEVDITAKLVPPTDIGPTGVTIDSRLGGIDGAITLGDPATEAINLTLELKAAFYLGFTLTLDGDVLVDSKPATASATMYSQVSADQLTVGTKLDIHKPTGGDLQVDLVQVETDILGLELDPIQDVVLTFLLEDLPFGLGPYQFDFFLSELVDINQLTDDLLDPITVDFLPFIVDLLAPLIEGFADDILKDLILSLQLETSFELPALLGELPEPKYLDLYTDLTSVSFTDEGGQIGLGVGLWSEKGVERDPLGAIQRAGCLKGQEDVFVYGWEKSLGAAAKTDLLNSALFAIWWSGYLDAQVDLSGLLDGLPIPLSDATVDLQWLLPPVINDCGPKGVLEAEVGDLYAVLDANLLGSPVTATLYLDAAVGLAFGADNGGLTVTVGEFKFLDAEVIQISESVGDLFDLKSLLEDDLQSLLGGYVTGETFGPIEIPAIPLSDLVPGVPPGVVLQLGNLGVSKDQGYVVVGGDLQ